MKIELDDLYRVKGIGNKTIERIKEQFKEKHEIVKNVKTFKSTDIGDSKLYLGDCLDVMEYLISKGVKVDAVITDPPYGTTACKWDSVIPFDEMWLRLNKLIKPNGAIVLFGSEPFSSALRMSNIKNYKYDWIWKKDKGGNIGVLMYQPSKVHEMISVFNKHKYYPIMDSRKEEDKRMNKPRWNKNNIQGGKKFFVEKSKGGLDYKYPISVREFNSVRGGFHPTQKPVALLEYLIKTYTNEGETVLDFTMGSGSTGIACKNLNRRFIGIEKDDNYFKIAKNRIKEMYI